MISFTPDHLDAMNREQERKIRTALEGSGVRVDEWPREQSFWRWIIGTIAAGVAMGIFLAWLVT